MSQFQISLCGCFKIMSGKVSRMKALNEHKAVFHFGITHTCFVEVQYYNMYIKYADMYIYVCMFDTRDWLSCLIILYICSINTHLAIVTLWTSRRIHSLAELRESISKGILLHVKHQKGNIETWRCDTLKETEPCSLFCQILCRVGCATAVSNLGHGQDLFPWSLVGRRLSVLMYECDVAKITRSEYK